MIFIIDIVILSFIAYKAITNSIKSDPLTEIAKLISIIIAILGATLIFPSLLENIIINIFVSLFEINKNQMDANFFNMIAFFIQFFIIYSIVSSFSKYLKDFINIKSKTIAGKMSTILPSIIRSILIVVIIIYSIESFPGYINQSKNTLKKSGTYNTLSKISHTIIK